MNATLYKLNDDGLTQVEWALDAFTRRLARTMTSIVEDAVRAQSSETQDPPALSDSLTPKITKFRNNMANAAKSLSNGMLIEQLPGTHLPDDWRDLLVESKGQIKSQLDHPMVFYTDRACPDIDLASRCAWLATTSSQYRTISVFTHSKATLPPEEVNLIRSNAGKSNPCLICHERPELWMPGIYEDEVPPANTLLTAIRVCLAGTQLSELIESLHDSAPETRDKMQSIFSKTILK
ncbi:hypothetical protein JIN77_02545 [Verrucomicrobiaceae bacterium R5-34]|nr:hypothetical protein [Verrucomicrobiaceae bacterium R5-34]